MNRKKIKEVVKTSVADFMGGMGVFALATGIPVTPYTPEGFAPTVVVIWDRQNGGIRLVQGKKYERELKLSRIEKRQSRYKGVG